MQVAHSSEDIQPCPYGTLGVIFMGVGVAEIDKQTVTEQLSDMPIVALDHVGTHPLILAHHITPVFRVELTGESRRVHQITEEDCELAAFRVRRSRATW
jgi:hypothetical protein